MPLYAIDSGEKGYQCHSSGVINDIESELAIDWHLDRDKSGRSPLHNAVLDEDYYKVKSILDNRSANINGRDHIKQTPLHIAALKGNIGIIKILLDKGADIKAKDKYGDTPLHIAVKKGYKDAVKVLLKGGADVNVKNNDHKKPIDYAYSTNDQEMIEIIRNAKGETYIDTGKQLLNVKSK
jgi:ankyrin repeat protein